MTADGKYGLRNATNCSNVTVLAAPVKGFFMTSGNRRLSTAFAPG